MYAVSDYIKQFRFSNLINLYLRHEYTLQLLLIFITNIICALGRSISALRQKVDSSRKTRDHLVWGAGNVDPMHGRGVTRT